MWQDCDNIVHECIEENLWAKESHELHSSIVKSYNEGKQNANF